MIIGAAAIEARRLGDALGHRREGRRVVLGEQALEEGVPSPARTRRPRRSRARRGARRRRHAPRARPPGPPCGPRSWSRSPRGCGRSRPSTSRGSRRRRRRRCGGGRSISSAASAWTRSLAAFASAAKRSMVSSRAASAVACMALVRSARNLLGLRAPALRAGTASAAGADSAPGADSTAASADADGLSVWAGSKSAVPVVSTWSAVAGSTSIMAAASVSSATGSPLSVVASAGALSGSASPRSEVQGSRNPGLVSVVAMDQKSSLVRVVDVAARSGWTVKVGRASGTWRHRASGGE